MGDAPIRAQHTTVLVEADTSALVQRIVASRQLQKAPQLREILVYIARRGLVENATAISEQEIGCNVLGRGTAFSPNDDNIVRVQVRHLRHKLDEYFNSDGAGEGFILTIPKGGYLPRIEPRTGSPVDAGIHPAAKPAAQDPAYTSLRATRPWWLLVVLGMVLAGLLAGSLFLRSESGTLHKTQVTDEVQEHRSALLWSRLFVPGRETNIVVADSSLAAVQDILDADIPLGEYLSGAYPEKLIESIPDKQLQAALRLLAGRQYTSWGDADVVSKLMDVSRHYTAQINICYSRFISSREFKSGNAILIGSRRGIPWEQLFEPQLNFSLEEDHATKKYYFRNKAPLADEQPIYKPSVGRDANTYADIALLPNLARTGTVLILAGIDMAATEAAGELVASPDFADVLKKILASRNGQPPASYVEMLMQAKAVAGSAQGRILAYRMLPAEPVASRQSPGPSRR